MQRLIEQNSRTKKLRVGFACVWGSITLFNLSSYSSAAELSLKDTITRAMQHSTSVHESDAEFSAQIEKRRGAWANAGPKISGDYNEAYYKDKQLANLGPQPVVIRDDVIKQGSITIAQPITGLYAVFEYAGLAGLQVDMAEQELIKSRRDAGFSAADAYLQAYLASEQEAISQASLDAAASQFKDAQAIQRVGRLSQADLLKFQLALSQARSRLAQAIAGRVFAFTALRLAIGARSDDNIVLQKVLPETVSAVDDIDQTKLLERPEYRQAEIGTRIAAKGIKVASAQFVPNINAFVKFDHNFGEAAGFGGGDKTTRYYGVSLQWELWNNGASTFAVREAIDRKTKAEYGLINARNGLELELVQSREFTKATMESLRLAEDAVKQAEESYRMDVVRFRSGQISATEMIQSEAARSNAQGQFIAAKTQLLQWNFKLQKAMGFTEPKI